MKYFKLPDLGEGLIEAEIREWFVKEGDSVAVDQQLLSVETAKAIVDIPSPVAGTIAKCFGQAGDLIHTGEALVEFAGAADDDSGTVVGELKQADSCQDDSFVIGAVASDHSSVKATPAVRELASRLSVDLSLLKGSGVNGLITTDDVERANQLNRDRGNAYSLRGVRRAMAKQMTKAQQEVCLVTVNDDVDVHHWPAGTDITMRLVSAIAAGCKAEPLLNSWYDGDTMSLRPMEQIDLGIAVDTSDGLFVPVLRDIGNRPGDELRQGLDCMREDINSRTIPPKELIGATITLSNFGTIAGRYATTVVVPPMVCIIGAGKIRERVVAYNGEPAVRKILPLSLSFDHRCITGGEATRFLQAMMTDLSDDKAQT